VIEVAIVTSTIKGQIVIPADLRKQFGISKGSRINIYEDGDKIVVKPFVEDPVQEGKGMLKTRGRILRTLMTDRKREAKQ
jgi:AbrB family looped-hinge helix DNA binding protein